MRFLAVDERLGRLWSERPRDSGIPAQAPPELAPRSGRNTQLNLEIFRIRQQFAELGVVESTQIIQPRPTTHELRIGAERLEVRTI